MLDPFGYQQNVNIFAIKVKCLDPKTYADRERKTLSFFINKLAKFLQDFPFATAFKGAYIKKKKKRKKKKKQCDDLSLVKSFSDCSVIQGFSLQTHFICPNQNLPRSSEKYSPLIF